MCPDNGESESKATIIDAVRTPLGFFTLAILILEGITLAFSAATQLIPIWMPLALIGLVIVFVFVIALYRPSVFYSLRAYRIVTMKFPEQIQVDFHDDSGELTIRPRQGRKRTKTFTPSCNREGGWFYRLPDYVSSDDQIRIVLNDTTGRVWRTTPFILGSLEQAFHLVNELGGR